MAYPLSARAGTNLGKALGHAIAFALETLAKRCRPGHGDALESPAPDSGPLPLPPPALPVFSPPGGRGFFALTRKDALSLTPRDRAPKRGGAGFFPTGDRAGHGENR